MLTNMKAVREAAVDWCLEKDLYKVVVFRKKISMKFLDGTRKDVLKSGLTWVH